jgi:hypothetical protein
MAAEDAASIESLNKIYSKYGLNAEASKYGTSIMLSAPLAKVKPSKPKPYPEFKPAPYLFAEYEIGNEGKEWLIMPEISIFQDYKNSRMGRSTLLTGEQLQQALKNLAEALKLYGVKENRVATLLQFMDIGKYLYATYQMRDYCRLFKVFNEASDEDLLRVIFSVPEDEIEAHIQQQTSLSVLFALYNSIA